MIIIKEKLVGISVEGALGLHNCYSKTGVDELLFYDHTIYQV